MSNHRENEEVLSMLWAALQDAGLEEQALRVKNARGNPLGVVLSELTIVERQVTDASVHRAVALAKQVLTGKRNDGEFERQCLKVQGLI